VLQDVAGAKNVKVEQTEGLPMMNVETDRAAIARYGLNVADVQDVVAVAVGGREAGQVFEGGQNLPIQPGGPDTPALPGSMQPQPGGPLVSIPGQPVTPPVQQQVNPNPAMAGIGVVGG